MSLLMFSLQVDDTQSQGFPLFARVLIGLGVLHSFAATHGFSLLGLPKQSQGFFFFLAPINYYLN